MPWLRTGTVACTLNSTTVTGTGTGFVANARVGDAFLGPDGHWYEVANIASDTALSILPAYLGATVSAGSYALAPMQGYVKDSADQLRTLVNKFGALAAAASINALAAVTGGTNKIAYFTAADVMATADFPAQARTFIAANTQAAQRTALGLGAVATESTVPVAKGGTGGTDQATARAGLGLGTASTATIGTVAGQVPVVGNFGVGDISISDASWNNARRTGFTAYSGAATGGPTFNGGSWYANGIDIVYGADSTVKTQLALRVNSGDFAMRSVNMNLAAASSWVYFWNTGNTTVDGSGFIKKASPIVRISDPEQSTRPDMLDGFVIAGYGAANEEAAGVTIERIAVGRYVIRGSLGLAKSGWQVNSPSDRNGGKLLGLAVGTDQDDGTILVEYRKIKYALTDDGDLEQIPGALIDAPLDNWIDVRIDMPAPTPYEPPEDAGGSLAFDSPPVESANQDPSPQ